MVGGGETRSIWCVLCRAFPEGLTLALFDQEVKIKLIFFFSLRFFSPPRHSLYSVEVLQSWELFDYEKEMIWRLLF